MTSTALLTKAWLAEASVADLQAAVKVTRAEFVVSLLHTGGTALNDLEKIAADEIRNGVTPETSTSSPFMQKAAATNKVALWIPDGWDRRCGIYGTEFTVGDLIDRLTELQGQNP